MAGCVVVKFVVFSLVLLEYASTSTYCRSVDQNQTPGNSPVGNGTRTDRAVSSSRKRENDPAPLYPLKQNLNISASNSWERIKSAAAFSWFRKKLAKVSELRDETDNKKMFHISERSRLFTILNIWRQMNLKLFPFSARLNISNNSKEYFTYGSTTNTNFDTSAKDDNSLMRDPKPNAENLHFSLIQKKIKEKHILKLVEGMKEFLFSRNLINVSNSRKNVQSNITLENFLNINGSEKLPYDWNWFRTTKRRYPWETTRKLYPWETTRKLYPWETTRKPYPWEVIDDPWQPNRNSYNTTDYSIGTVLLMVFGITALLGLLAWGIKCCIDFEMNETEIPSTSTSTRSRGMILHRPPEARSPAGVDRPSFASRMRNSLRRNDGGTPQEPVLSFTNHTFPDDAEISIYTSDARDSFGSHDEDVGGRGRPTGARGSRNAPRINIETSGRPGDRPPDYSAVVVSDSIGERANTYGVVVPKPLDSPPPNYDVIQANTSAPTANL